MTLIGKILGFNSGDLWQFWHFWQLPGGRIGRSGHLDIGKALLLMTLIGKDFEFQFPRFWHFWQLPDPRQSAFIRGKPLFFDSR
jgi:hypothetical protein